MLFFIQFLFYFGFMFLYAKNISILHKNLFFSLNEFQFSSLFMQNNYYFINNYEVNFYVNDYKQVTILNDWSIETFEY